MKKSDLKRLLKPLIKECIKECLYEEGTLSSVVEEVVRGMNGNVIRESVKPVEAPTPIRPVRNNNLLKEHRQKLLDAVGKDSYGGVDIFEGIVPMRGQQSPESMASNPLGDMDPGDAGVDISGIVALGGRKWKAFTG